MIHECDDFFDFLRKRLEVRVPRRSASGYVRHYPSRLWPLLSIRHSPCQEVNDTRPDIMLLVD